MVARGGLISTLAVASGLAIALVLPVVSTSGSAAAPLRLSLPTAYGTHLPGLGAPARSFADTVADLSGGSLVFDVSQPGELVMPQDILQQVSAGKVDAGFAKAGFWAGRLPAASLFSGFPFGPDAQTYAEWFYAGDGLKLYQEMYDQAKLNVKVLPCGFAGAETAGWFAKEIKSPADIKGLRMRIFGLGGLVMARLGAKPALVPGGALAQAFQQGRIDAAELYPPAVDDRESLAGSVKLIYEPGWHQPETVMELLINKDRWDALDDRQQHIVETACRSNMLQTMAENPVLRARALADFAAHGVKIETLPDSVLAALHRSWDAVAADEAARDPFFQEVLNDIRRFRGEPAPGPAKAPAAADDTLLTGSTR